MRCRFKHPNGKVCHLLERAGAHWRADGGHPFQPQPAPAVDVTFVNDGSIVLMTPESDAGRAWIDAHIAGEVQMIGNTIAIERRYADAIVAGTQADGLHVELRGLGA